MHKYNNEQFKSVVCVKILTSHLNLSLYNSWVLCAVEQRKQFFPKRIPISKQMGSKCTREAYKGTLPLKSTGKSAIFQKKNFLTTHFCLTEREHSIYQNNSNKEIKHKNHTFEIL